MPTPAVLVRRFGLGLVLAGTVAGAAVYATAADDAAADAVAQQREMRELARLGGTAGVEAVQFRQWLGSLWEGRRLGVTLAVLGLVLGLACRHLGGLMEEDDPA